MVKRLWKSYKYVLLLGVIACCLAVKCFFGFGWDDEGYYLSAAHRIFMGEIPLYQEWFPASLFGVLLFPVYALYRMVVGSEAGVVLFFRLFYLLLLFANSVLVFCIIKKYTKKAGVAFFAAAFLLVYSKQNMALYSYNDLAVGSLVLTAMLLLYSEMTQKKKKSIYFAAGISFVLTVFCNPYCIFIWLYFAILSVFLWKREKDGARLGFLVCFTAGCCLLGFAFLGFLFSQAPFGELLESLYYVINGFGFVEESIAIKLMKWCWYSVKTYGIAVLLLQIPIFFYALVKAYRKNLTSRQKHVLAGIEVVCAVVYLLGQFVFLDDRNVIGIAYIPLSVLALLCFIMTEKRDWKVFWILYVPGILMSMAFQCSSGTGIYAITTGFTVSAIGSVLLLAAYWEENLLDKPWGLYLILSVVLAGTFAMRLTYSRQNGYEEHYDCRIENGPYRGIMTDERQKEFYEQTIAELAMLEQQTAEGDHVFLLGRNTWMYLCLDRKAGTPTTWRMEPENELFREYFVLHPDKVPDWIYEDGMYAQREKEILLDETVYQEIYHGTGSIYGIRESY